jgi:hypothetical protein
LPPAIPRKWESQHHIPKRKATISIRSTLAAIANLPNVFALGVRQRPFPDQQPIIRDDARENQLPNIIPTSRGLLRCAACND